MAMFSFSGAILLVGMGARDMMSNANLLKENMQLFILATPISLHSNNFPIKLALNIFLKIKEHLIHIGTRFEKVNPSELAKIIDKAYIV